jgi:hypothetical protein
MANGSRRIRAVLGGTGLLVLLSFWAFWPFDDFVAGLIFFLVVACSFVAYIAFVRTRIGSALIGIGMLAATLAALIRVSVGPIDDGLEGLWLPFATWGVAIVTLPIEGLARLLSAAGRRSEPEK